MARSIRKSTKNGKAGKAKQLAKTVIALAATALLEKAVQKAMNDPAFRRKAIALAKAAGARSKAAGKKLRRAAKKRRSARA